MLHYALFAVIVLAVLCYMDWQVRRVFSFYGIGRKKWYIICFRAVLFSGVALLITLWSPGIVIHGKSERLSAEEILEGADRERYIIMLDHQPVETAMNGGAGVALQLSGHTHAGQAFPGGLFMRVMGMPCYGEYQENGCELIVSSGASVGVFPIRTENIVNMW